MRSLKFHPDYIRSLMSEKDIHVFDLGSRDQIDQRINEASGLLSDINYKIGIPHLRKIGRKVLSRPRSWEDKIYLAHLNRNLRLFYRVEFGNRRQIVTNLISNMKAGVPFSFFRSDIKSFFESIPLEDLINKIDTNGYLRRSELSNLRILLDAPKRKKLGVMRGLSISSTLSEIHLKEFDRNILRMDGVVYYRRYVDDFLILSSKTNESLEEKVKNLLPKELKLNPGKTQQYSEHASDYSSSNTFSFLGYEFTRTLTKKASVVISLSDSKIIKIKNRISRSTKDFQRNRDMPLLKKRIRLITGNYKLNKSGHEEPIFVGIYYNHSHLDDGHKSLDELDRFLKNKLIYIRRWLKSRGHRTDGIETILKISFVKGYTDKISHRFGRGELINLTKIWQNE